MVDLVGFVDGVPLTVCTYLEDSYTRSAGADIVKVAQEKKSAYVVLDRTIFHPKSGGQPSDQGTIEGITFRVDVKRAMLVNLVIIHYGKTEGIPVPGPVTCSIDWSNRLMMMRRHTAAHLLDYCLSTVSKSQVETTDSWLGEDPYVGYGGSPPESLDLKRIEDLGNDFIRQALKVEIKTLARTEAERLIADAPNILRLPKTERLRIVTIEGQLPIPCGGTHVQSLGEIGSLEVRRIDSAEKGFRLHFEVR